MARLWGELLCAGFNWGRGLCAAVVGDEVVSAVGHLAGHGCRCAAVVGVAWGDVCGLIEGGLAWRRAWHTTIKEGKQRRYWRTVLPEFGYDQGWFAGDALQI